jgi:glycosyltransferase involved in cell wall biosynthesis
VPLDEFEDLLAGCAVLVLPLQAGGEACGQTVLVTGIRCNRPVIATRHDSLVDYLGHDYPGFVSPHDADALRAAVDRALYDGGFRQLLVDRIAKASETLEAMSDLEEDFLRILARPKDASDEVRIDVDGLGR